MNIIHKSKYNTKNIIIINKSGYLKYKNLKFRCALGKAGIGNKKIEGDNVTPRGVYKIIKIYFRKDRIRSIATEYKLIKITKKMGWCDDPKSKKYNQKIKIPTSYSYERLYRKDNIYDLILVISYNINPIVKKKGSAIFIHIAKKNYQPTQGCIALKKGNLIKLISKIKKDTKIRIN